MLWIQNGVICEMGLQEWNQCILYVYFNIIIYKKMFAFHSESPFNIHISYKHISNIWEKPLILVGEKLIKHVFCGSFLCIFYFKTGDKFKDIMFRYLKYYFWFRFHYQQTFKKVSTKCYVLVVDSEVLNKKKLRKTYLIPLLFRYHR